MAAAPGKAVLLEAVREAGSIAAAGGARGGRARLSPLGAEVLAAYREMEAATLAATETRRAWLRARLARR
jgi:molybdate transport system regulatory protein